MRFSYRQMKIPTLSKTVIESCVFFMNMVSQKENFVNFKMQKIRDFLKYLRDKFIAFDVAVIFKSLTIESITSFIGRNASFAVINRDFLIPVRQFPVDATYISE